MQFAENNILNFGLFISLSYGFIRISLCCLLQFGAWTPQYSWWMNYPFKSSGAKIFWVFPFLFAWGEQFVLFFLRIQLNILGRIMNSVRIQWALTASHCRWCSSCWRTCTNPLLCCRRVSENRQTEFRSRCRTDHTTLLCSVHPPGRTVWRFQTAASDRSLYQLGRKVLTETQTQKNQTPRGGGPDYRLPGGGGKKKGEEFFSASLEACEEHVKRKRELYLGPLRCTITYIDIN